MAVIKVKAGMRKGKIVKAHTRNVKSGAKSSGGKEFISASSVKEVQRGIGHRVSRAKHLGDAVGEYNVSHNTQGSGYSSTTYTHKTKKSSTHKDLITHIKKQYKNQGIKLIKKVPGKFTSGPHAAYSHFRNKITVTHHKK